jgi:uncharacterized membrane protein
MTPAVAYLQRTLLSARHLVSKPNFQALALATMFAGVASFVSIHLLHDSYKSYALDLGLFTQALKYTSEGHPLYHTIGGLSHLAYHFSPILFLLVPIYWVAPYCQTLLVVQAIALGLGGYLVYYLAKNFKLSHRVSLFIEVLFFINPLVWGLALFDFHEVALAVPALLVMFIGLHQKRWLLFSVGLVLSLMTKEDVVITLGVFGTVMLIASYLKNKKVDYAALIILCSALVTYGIAILISAVASNGEYPRILTYFSVRYTYLKLPLGQAISGVISTVTGSGSWFLILAYLAPLGFIPLFSFAWVIPALFNLALNMLSTCPAQQYDLQQSSTMAIPFLFMAMIVALAKLGERKDLPSLQTRLGKNFPVLIAITMVLTSLALDFRPNSRIDNVSWPGPHEKAINQVIAIIPDGATVTANNSIFPHLVTRTETYLPLFTDPFTPVGSHAQWGFPDRETEYVVIDRDYRQLSPGGYWENKIKNELNQKYELIADIDGARLYQLRHNPAPAP